MTKVPRLEVPQFHFPEPISIATHNGAGILLVPMKTATTISLAVVAREGYSTEPIGGLAALTASLLVCGTRQRSEADFVRAIDRLGATIQPLMSAQKIGIEIVGLPEHLAELVALGAECILEPAFDPTEFEKAKTRLLSSFPLALSQSGYRAERIFSKLRFPNHPLSRPRNGTPTSVASIECDQVRQWYQAILREGKWHVLMIGAFDPATASELLVRSFATLGAGTRQQPTIAPDPPSAVGIGQGLLTEQVELRLGVPTLPYTSDGYPAALLASTAFAGHFRSRINLLVREQQGLTYGAFGNLTAGKHTGTFILSTSTTPANLPLMMTLLLEQWQRLATEPFTEDEIHAARQFLYSSFWRSIETPDAIGSIAITLALDDLPPDYYTRLLTTLERLEPSHLLSVQEQVFAPARLLIAAVGSLEHLQEVMARYGTPQHVLLEEEQQ